MSPRKLLLFFTLATILETITASRILVLFIIGGKSHRVAFDPLILSLASRGHHITIVSYAFKPERHIPNIIEINGPTIADTLNFFPNPYTDRLQNPNGIDTISILPFMFPVCSTYFQIPEVHNLLDKKFDLVMMDAIGNECGFGFLTHFKIPYILLAPLPLVEFARAELGIPNIPTVKPYMFSDLPEDMSLWQRISNLYSVVVNLWQIENYFELVAHHYRQNFPEAPSVQEVYQNSSLVFQNVHHILDLPMLSVPGLINTGGMHCRAAIPLPKDLQEFLDEAGSTGVIYMSMGSFTQGIQMPLDIRTSFVRAFAKLPQKVLWKYEAETMDDVNLPENIRLIKWAPQQDVLAHKNVKLIITQGGLMTTQEILYHGVPSLGIPLMFDQDRNINRLCEMGLGMRLELGDVTEKTLLTKINQILSDSRFERRAESKAAEFQNQPISSLDLAVSWTEHILENGKPSNLFPLARKYSVFKFYGLDILLICLSFLLTIIIVVSVAVYKVKSHFLNRANKVHLD